MKAAWIALVLATTASGDVIPTGKDDNDEDTFKVADRGPVLGYAIFSIYQEATKFCAKENKEVATVEMKQDNEPQPQHKLLDVELTFKCALKTTKCDTLITEGATVYALSHAVTLKDGTTVHPGDVKLRDGTIIRSKQCSDAERSRWPPPP